MKADPENPLTDAGERHPLKNRTAEQIAATADRLEQQAAELRATDKQLALQLLREATRLRRVARALDIQYKRAQRARRQRQHPSNPLRLDPSWNAFLADKADDDGRLG